MNAATRSIEPRAATWRGGGRILAGTVVLACIVAGPAGTGWASGPGAPIVTVTGVRIAPNGHMDVHGRGAPGGRVRLEVQGVVMVGGVVGADGGWVVSNIATHRGGTYEIRAWSDRDVTRMAPADSLRVVVPAETATTTAARSEWLAQLDGMARHLAGSVERAVADTIGVRLAQAQSGGAQPPPRAPSTAPGGAGDGDDVVSRIRRWLDRADREYREQIVPRLSGDADRKPPPTPAAPVAPGDGGQRTAPKPGDWAPPSVDDIKQRVERWINRSRSEYHGEVVPRLSGQKPPGVSGGQAGDAERAREQAAEAERRRREAARAAAAAEQRERERTAEQARRAAAAAVAAERQRQAAQREAAQRAAEQREAEQQQMEQRQAEARAADERAARARQAAAESERRRQAEARAAEERAARERQSAAAASQSEAERRAQELRDAQRLAAERREEERRTQESAARAIAAAQEAAERERRRIEAEVGEQRASAEARAAAEARRRAEEERVAEARRQADQRAARARERAAGGVTGGPQRDPNDPAFAPDRRQPGAVRQVAPAPTPAPAPVRRPEPRTASERQPALPVRRPAVVSELPPIPQPSPTRAARAPTPRPSPGVTGDTSGSGVARSSATAARPVPRPAADPYRPDTRSALGAPVPRYRSERRQNRSAVSEGTRCRAAGRPANGRRPYVVARGDSLWRISQAHYRRGSRYRVIWRANARKIRDPDLIFPCQRFRIPKLSRRR